MHRLAILDDFQRAAEKTDWSAISDQVQIEIFDRPFPGPDALVEALRGFDMLCLLRERTPFPASLIGKLTDVRFIGVTGAHNRTLDLAAACERGIVVSHTRNGSSEYPTAELTWGLILAAARQIPGEERALRAGAWQTAVGTTLYGKTLGLLGLGRIGRRVAAIGAAFGMNVVAWSPNLTDERAGESGVTRVDRDELFSLSDVLSIHLVLGDATRGIVGARELALMRPSSILVNTSRGPLVDEAALIETLNARRIRAAALDVFDREPLAADHPLHSVPNTVLTPHLGFVTEEVYSVLFGDTAENIAAYLAGAPIRVMRPAAG
jgi:D-3-phosphoglycerate dehydrogenase